MFMTISDTDCFDFGSDYAGPDLQNKTGIGSAMECFIASINLDGSNYFTYDNVNQNCQLKSAKSGYQNDAGAVSGGIATCVGTSKSKK